MNRQTTSNNPLDWEVNGGIIGCVSPQVFQEIEETEVEEVETPKWEPGDSEEEWEVEELPDDLDPEEWKENL